MKVLMVAPVLPEDVRQQAEALARRGTLQALVTGWVVRRPQPSKLERFDLRPRSRRPALSVPPEQVRAAARVDVAQAITRLRTRSGTRAADARFAATDRLAARYVDGASIVLAREDGCLESFSEASRLGALRALDLPNPHFSFVREIAERERAEFPGICRSVSDPQLFAADRIQRKSVELETADAILVPSSFARRSLVERGVPETKIQVIPFGASPRRSDRGTHRRREPMFLHVGQISMRKGVHRLLRAWKRLKAHRTHRLRLVGTMRLDPLFLRDYQGVYEHVPQITRRQLPEQYLRARALVLNSMAEGFGLVIPEAMGCGTPVLSSRNNGAPDLIGHEREGLLFDYGEDEDLEVTLDYALTHPDRMAEMGVMAHRRAASRTWSIYRSEFADWIAGLARPESALAS